MKKTVAGILSFAFFSCIFFSKLSAQQTLILRGRVVDEQTGETLSDANVFDLTSGIGVSTNSYGVYSLSLGKGKRIIRCSLLGYTTRTDTLDITSDKVLNFALKPGNYQLKDVEIVADRRHSGQFRLGQQDIQAMPEWLVEMKEPTISRCEAVINGGILFCSMRLLFLIQIMLFLSFRCSTTMRCTT